MRVTREQMLDVALEVLGQNPDASMADVATAAGVVRRTVYGHFPSREDLVLALTRRVADELVTVLAEVTAGRRAADTCWAQFVARLWPVAHRYRVLMVLRRSEYGEEIHALLAPVEDALAELVTRGQRSGAFGRHLPADVLSRITLAAVFAVAAEDLARSDLGVDAATTTSLLLLGVPGSRARTLVPRPSRRDRQL